MEEQIDHPMIEQKESVKLIKGAKGYRWEIKIHIDPEKDHLSLIRLHNLDKQMREQYGETDNA